jgi:hypothetical protein
MRFLTLWLLLASWLFANEATPTSPKFEIVPSVGYTLNNSNSNINNSPFFGVQTIALDYFGKNTSPYVSLYGTAVSEDDKSAISQPFEVAFTAGVYRYFPDAFGVNWIMPITHLGVSYVYTHVNDQEVPTNNVALSYGLGAQFPLSNDYAVKFEVVGLAGPNSSGGVANSMGVALGLVIPLY